jgi:hypothetical protein
MNPSLKKCPPHKLFGIKSLQKSNRLLFDRFQTVDGGKQPCFGVDPKPVGTYRMTEFPVTFVAKSLKGVCGMLQFKEDFDIVVG